MHYIKPPPLQRGDTIGIVSPSSPVERNALTQGLRYLEEKGFKIQFGKHAYDVDRFLAGTDQDRVNDIMDFYRDPTIKAIFASRGGQGSQRLLPYLKCDVIRQNPKALVGFSDTTALQLGILNLTGIISYTGYTLTVELNDLLDSSLSSCLMGKPYTIEGGTFVHGGSAKGPLIGGNLTLLTALLGTPFQPDFKGAILLIEEVGIEPYHVDCMLSHLDLTGVFQQVAGVVLGQFEECVSKHKNSGTVTDVIQDWVSRLSIPCLIDFPHGHGKMKSALPIGGMVFLDADKKELNIL